MYKFKSLEHYLIWTLRKHYALRNYKRQFKNLSEFHHYSYTSFRARVKLQIKTLRDYRKYVAEKEDYENDPNYSTLF